MLKCNGVSGVVECPAELKYVPSYKLDFFAIAISEESKLEEKQIKYSLYPRKLDNSAWTTNVVLDNETPYKISLFQSEKITDKGLRVRDIECFNRIIELFKVSKRYELAYLRSDLTVKPTIRIIGEMYISESTLESLKNQYFY